MNSEAPPSDIYALDPTEETPGINGAKRHMKTSCRFTRPQKRFHLYRNIFHCPISLPIVNVDVADRITAIRGKYAKILSLAA